MEFANNRLSKKLFQRCPSGRKKRISKKDVLCKMDKENEGKHK